MHACLRQPILGQIIVNFKCIFSCCVLIPIYTQYTLLTEVRELIRDCDLETFDDLIYNKEKLQEPVTDDSHRRLLGRTHYQQNSFTNNSSPTNQSHLAFQVN